LSDHYFAWFNHDGLSRTKIGTSGVRPKRPVAGALHSPVE
jgi:hypothetical protein